MDFREIFNLDFWTRADPAYRAGAALAMSATYAEWRDAVAFEAGLCL